MTKLDKNTFMPIGFALFLAMTAVGVASNTSARFTALEKDINHHSADIDLLIFEIREMRKDIGELKITVELLSKSNED